MTGADWLYEDFTVGRQALSAARTITEDDIDAFARLTGDHHPLHVDADYAATTEFGGRIAHGLLGLGIAAGLLHRQGIIGLGVVALLGVSDWQFAAPVQPGDALVAATTVRAARLSRRSPDRGIVTLEVAVRRSDGVDVQRGVLSLLVRRQGAA